MPVRVVTDSTADLPAEVVSELGITVVPLQVVFGDRSLRDGIDIDSDAFYRQLASSPVHPTTSQPSAGDFEAVYRRLSDESADIVSVHISANLSGTIRSAETAREALPGSRIEIVDSMTASFGLGIAVLKAAEAAQAGASMQEVADVARDVSTRQQITFALDTLEYLKRGGRLGRGAALLGSLLSIKPLLEVRDGEVWPLERQRTRKRALERLYERAAEVEGVTDYAVVHATTPDDARELFDRLKAQFPNARGWSGRLGPVVGVHAGPGAIGVLTLAGKQP